MTKDFRKKLMIEIAMKIDCNHNLNYVLKKYNDVFPNLNAKESDFCLRLAKTPEEAAYCSTVIYDIKENINYNNVEEFVNKVKLYSELMSYIFKKKILLNNISVLS